MTILTRRSITPIIIITTTRNNNLTVKKNMQENNNTTQITLTPTKQQREDCWSEQATWTLTNSWGTKFLEVNRGNLRQKDWQFVANSVNSVHGHELKNLRTDVQCKNRIDTLKKKYKSERARVFQGGEKSTWMFYDKMDELVGCVYGDKKVAKQKYSSERNSSGMNCGSGGWKFGQVLPQKRLGSSSSSPLPVDDSYFRRNYSAIAAAAAAEVEDEDGVQNSDSSEEEIEEVSDGDGMKRLTRAIEKLGEMYERVEGEKQKQMIELEKLKMQFAKDMEVQRMQLFMDTQVQLEKIKQAKRSGSNDFRS